LKYLKMIAILLAFTAGYGLSEYVSQRSLLVHKIDDYQKEILISMRLLQVYARSCDVNAHGNFSAYVEHATAAYDRLLTKAEIFPFYLTNEFINDHQDSVLQFYEEILSSKQIADQCGKTPH
jgi:hypothetical protein